MLNCQKLLLFLLSLLLFTTTACGPYEQEVQRDDVPEPSVRVPNSNNSTEPEEPDNNTEAPTEDSVFLTVSNQTLNNPYVIHIQSLQVQGPSWIVIYRDTNNSLGEVIGSYRIEGVGKFDNISLQLDAPATDEETLHAQLHSDQGRLRVLELPEPDVPTTDNDGNQVISTFNVSVLPPPIVDADDIVVIDPINRITLNKVQTHDDAWVALFEDDNGQQGDYIGHTEVSAGITENVDITTERYLEHQQPLMAFLYKRQGNPNNFDPENSILEPITYIDAAVTAHFQVQYPEELYPQIEINPFSTTADSVTAFKIASINSPADGFVAIYPNGNLANPSMVSVAIEKGLNTDIEIQLPEAHHITETTSLYVALQLIDGQTLFFDGQAVSKRMDIVLEEEIFPGIGTSNHNLTQLTTAVTIDSISTPEPAWVVIYTTSNSLRNEIIGTHYLDSGIYNNVVIPLTQRTIPGEIYQARLHRDIGQAEVFEYPGGPDTPYTDDNDDDVAAAFSVTHTSGIPDIRMTVEATANQYSWIQIEPETFSENIQSADTANPSLRFEDGWRYEIRNLAAATHPLEIVDTSGDTDVVLISQNDPGSGQVAGDPQVAMQVQVGGSTFRFTFAPSMSENTDLIYRCTFHPQTMYGAVNSDISATQH